jgi:hypothetical protein
MSFNDEFRNLIRREAARFVADTIPGARNAIISSYDPQTYAIKVKIMPEAGDPQPGETPESGWIPIKSPWIGNGWGIFFGPSIGDQVQIEFQENDIGSGSHGGAFFDQSHVPLPVPSGEVWLVHKSGSYFKLTNDGKVSLASGQEIDAGNLTQTVQAICLQAFYDWAANHTHPNTGPPTTQPPANSLTTILKAN